MHDAVFVHLLIEYLLFYIVLYEKVLFLVLIWYTNDFKASHVKLFHSEASMHKIY